MDEFAQSREDDDLFADEFEPVSTPSFTVDESTPAVAEVKPAAPAGNRRRGEGQERRQRGGRGVRGGGGDGAHNAHNGLKASRYAPKVESTQDAEPVQTDTQPKETSSDPDTANHTASSVAPPQNSSESTNTTATVPSANPSANNRIPAVRGDRSATGGPAHKKLTEEELAVKLEKMAIINAQKSERHRLSEADQAAFQQREKELAKERKQKAVAERKNERVMEMERAKNRERKMKAQGGREWDSEKLETDIVDGKSRGRSSEYVRGGHGGVIRGRAGGLAGSRYAVSNDDVAPDSQATRGRGNIETRGRGGGGNRGAIKGKSHNAAPIAEDFPALPIPTKSPESSSAPANQNSPGTPKIVLKSAAETYALADNLEKVSPEGSKAADNWADEMATPVEKTDS